MKIKHLFILLNCFILIPIFGSILTNEVHWTFYDYALALILLNGMGFSFYLISRYVTMSIHKYLLFSVILFLFFLIWAELAIGIFDSIFAGS